MRKWIFVCAVVTLAGFLAEPAPAQEAVPAPGPGITSAGPRAGLISRLRDRRPMTILSQRTTTVTTSSAPAKVVQAQATEAPKTPITPMTTATQVVENRQGLLSRLRARVGR